MHTTTRTTGLRCFNKFLRPEGKGVADIWQILAQVDATGNGTIVVFLPVEESDRNPNRWNLRIYPSKAGSRTRLKNYLTG